MAFEPYIMGRKQGCFRGAPLHESTGQPRLPEHTPYCTIDKYTDSFRRRWNVLRADVCNRCPSKPLCPIKPKYQVDHSPALYGPDRTLAYHEGGEATHECTDICIPQMMYDRDRTTYKKDFAFPWSHNNVDDCCKAECPCLDISQFQLQQRKGPDENCKERPPLEPLEKCTTYKHFFHDMPTPPPPRRQFPEPYAPCECPLESATSYRLEFEPKSTVPQGIPFAKCMRRGLWSVEQFDKDFSADTTSRTHFTPKDSQRHPPNRPIENLKCETGRVSDTTETCAEFGKKVGESMPQIPSWIHNETWLPPESPLETCTTYNHFYKRHPMRPYPGYEVPIRSPDAIPFSTISNMWYTCCDPVVDQRIPVEMKDDDPWPRVTVEPFIYQDNLQTDPCAPFRDETTHKAEFVPKRHWVPNKWYGPSEGYTPPILPFNDNTTTHTSYVAYPPQMIREAKPNPGNPNGIKWGPYKCQPEEDKCRPRFPPPYGDPLKPYTRQCPCGQFDDRSMYHHDFKFWTPEMVDLVNEEHCRDICVPKGLSLYRADYSDGSGKKAEVMPPPKSKGQRCMRPCSYHDLDSLYNLKYKNFWKDLPAERVDKYRGKPTIRTRRVECKNQKPPEAITVFQMPAGTTVQDTLRYLERNK